MARDGSETKIEKAISALLSCGTIIEAAEQAKIPRRTLTRWLADEGFRQKLREARAEAFSHALGRA